MENKSTAPSLSEVVEKHDLSEQLASAVETVKVEASRNPEKYLKDAIVPEGGE